MSDFSAHFLENGYTPEVQQFAPEKLPSQKERLVFQPSIFRKQQHKAMNVVGLPCQHQATTTDLASVDLLGDLDFTGGTTQVRTVTVGGGGWLVGGRWRIKRGVYIFMYIYI